jgi:UDP-N-acetylmuramoyl-tripeptide--D-alanyl-D-alanine ligase
MRFLVLSKMQIKELHDLFLASTGVTTDSRVITPGNMFIALRGDNFDGHAFVRQALDEGCSLAVIDKAEFAVPGRTIIVENVLKSLQQLASFHRRLFDIPVLAITGSNGKTTTRELISIVLSRRHNTLSTRGNLNNHIGVPLTLLGLTAAHDIAVIEMGANHLGEIDELCRIAQPGYGLITNVGSAHLEGFGTLAGVLKAKTELFRFIRETGGKAFLNCNRQNLVEVSKEIQLEYITFGSADECNVSGKIKDSSNHLQVEVRIKETGEKITLNTRLAGAYNFENILAAMCVGNYFGIPASLAGDAIEGYQPDNNRSQIMQTERNRLLLDAYNANPDSMQAAIMNFSFMEGEKKAVIIGDMLELGEFTAGEHQKIVDILKAKRFNEVFLVGDHFCKTDIPESYLSFNNVRSLISWLEKKPLNDRFILLKGSRGIKLEQCIAAL